MLRMFVSERDEKLKSANSNSKSRYKQAVEDPENLGQESIMRNLSPAEAERLSHVRNIGIAVSHHHCSTRYAHGWIHKECS